MGVLTWGEESWGIPGGMGCVMSTWISPKFGLSRPTNSSLTEGTFLSAIVVLSSIPGLRPSLAPLLLLQYRTSSSAWQMRPLRIWLSQPILFHSLVLFQLCWASHMCSLHLCPAVLSAQTLSLLFSIWQIAALCSRVTCTLVKPF